MNDELDNIADEMFEATFYQLSPWGKQKVTAEYFKRTKIDAPRTATLQTGDDPATLLKDNERLARDLESSRMENLDLWDEVTELKAQIAEIQAKFNRPSSS